MNMIRIGTIKLIYIFAKTAKRLFVYSQNVFFKKVNNLVYVTMYYEILKMVLRSHQMIELPREKNHFCPTPKEF